MNSQPQASRVVVFNNPIGSPTSVYPPHRPLHIYRQSLSAGCVSYGRPIKFLVGGDCCVTEGASQPSLISFSGRAQIRPASTIVNNSEQISPDNPIVRRKYNQNYEQYMRSRGTMYETKLVGAPVAGTNYTIDCTPVAPDAAQPVSLTSSAIYQGSASNSLSCNVTVYKPNNAKFAQQGAVSSASRLDRLKQDLKLKVANPLKPGVKRQISYSSRIA